MHPFAIHLRIVLFKLGHADFQNDRQPLDLPNERQPRRLRSVKSTAGSTPDFCIERVINVLGKRHKAFLCTPVRSSPKRHPSGTFSNGPRDLR